MHWRKILDISAIAAATFCCILSAVCGNVTAALGWGAAILWAFRAIMAEHY